MCCTSITRAIMTAVTILLLTGCTTMQTAPQISATPQVFNVAEYAPLPLNARRLEIIDNWQMPVAEPYVGHWVDPLPINILVQWAGKVLKPSGGSGEIILDIKTVSITVTDLPVKVGLDGLLTDQQNRKITAKIEMQLMWLQPVGGTQANARLEASQSITIAESANLVELNKAIFESFVQALRRLDAETRTELAKIDRMILRP